MREKTNVFRITQPNNQKPKGGDQNHPENGEISIQIEADRDHNDNQRNPPKPGQDFRVNDLVPVEEPEEVTHKDDRPAKDKFGVSVENDFVLAAFLVFVEFSLDPAFHATLLISLEIPENNLSLQSSFVSPNFMVSINA